MNTDHVIVHGMVKSDGTLQLDERLTLPPGRVQVTVQPAPVPAGKGNIWATLERIWAERKARGTRSRTREEIDSSIRSMREEWEGRQEGLEQIQDRVRQGREHRPC